MTSYVFNSAWRFIEENEALIVTAGADKQFVVEEITLNGIAQLIALSGKSSFTKKSIPKDLQETFDQLLFAEVFRPVIVPAGRKTKVHIIFSGTENTQLKKYVYDQLPAAYEYGAKKDAELLLVVRTTASLAELTEDIQHITQPHILIDLAYDHTISLGPLVVLGDTACIACLTGRISLHWGDAMPPENPQAGQYEMLIAGLVLQALQSLPTSPERLMNCTVVYDLEQQSVKKHMLIRYPSCPVCSTHTPVRGQVRLPWL